jgi:DNA topoisomerase-6 subunit B
MIIEGIYTRGPHSVMEYLKNTSIANPFANIVIEEPDGKITEFPRVSNQLPKRAKEIKLHPYGVEFGILERMLKETRARTIKTFLTTEFSRVGDKSAQEICEKAGLTGKEEPQFLLKEKLEDLLKAMHSTPLQKPELDCLSPIGEELIIKGLKKEFNPEFVCAITRPPSVYRGMPFQIEAAIAYGGDIKEEEHDILRFANKVPLLYNQSACVTLKAVNKIDWSRYGFKVGPGGLFGPVIILMHMCSVWVPFTSEGKEAIADYPEILREMKLALQELGRKLKLYVGKKHKLEAREKKLKIYRAYSREIAKALAPMLGKNEEEINNKFEKLLEIKLGEIKEEEVDERAEEVESEDMAQGEISGGSDEYIETEEAELEESENKKDEEESE